MPESLAKLFDINNQDKNLVVVGDLMIAWHYWQDAVTATSNARDASLKNWSGAAVFAGVGTIVRQLITLGCNPSTFLSFDSTPTIVESEKAAPILGYKFAQTPRSRNKKDKENKVWRVSESLGWSKAINYDQWIIASRKPYNAKVTVAFDAGFGFFNSYFENPVYSSTLSSVHEHLGRPSGSLVLVHSRLNVPPDYLVDEEISRNKIARHLSCSLECVADDLAVVVSAQELRNLGVDISRGISWERTLQSLCKAAECGFSGAAAIPGILEAATVFVSFGADGIVRIDRSKRTTVEQIVLAFHPSSIEGDTYRQSEGITVGESYFITSMMASYASKAAEGAIHATSQKALRCPELLKATLLVIRHAQMEGSARTIKEAAEGSKDLEDILNAANLPQVSRFGNASDTHPLWKMRFAWELANETTHEEWSKKITAKCIEQDIRHICVNPAHIPQLENYRPLPTYSSKDDHYHYSWWTLQSQLICSSNGISTTDSTKVEDDELLKRYLTYALQVLKYGGPGEKEYLPDNKVTPYVVYDKFIACDRAEIESFRNLASITLEYVSQKDSTRPLNIAVFGPPGSGKSFGVKNLMRSLHLSKEVKFLDFNLSQLSSPEALSGCFQAVQDEVLAGNLPVVFWDEYDTTLGDQEFGWLSSFLAPMQDGHFVFQNRNNPLGKCIFVFAGSRFSSFRELPDPSIPIARPRAEVITLSTKEAEERALKSTISEPTPYEQETTRQHLLSRLQEFWRQAKGHDFRSRLKGFLDVREPNLEPVKHDGAFLPFNPTSALTCGQAAFLVRRARFVRSMLLDKHPQLFVEAEFDITTLVKGDSGVEWEFKMAPGAPGARKYRQLKARDEVLVGFLTPYRFSHGARSIESIIDASSLTDAPQFDRSCLPPGDILSIHVPPVAFENRKDLFAQWVDDFRRCAIPPSGLSEEFKTDAGYEEVKWEKQSSVDEEKYLLLVHCHIRYKGSNRNVSIPDGFQILVSKGDNIDVTKAEIIDWDSCSPHLLTLSSDMKERLLDERGSGKISVGVRLYRGLEVGEPFWLEDLRFENGTHISPQDSGNLAGVAVGAKYDVTGALSIELTRILDQLKDEIPATANLQGRLDCFDLFTDRDSLKSYLDRVAGSLDNGREDPTSLRFDLLMVDCMRRRASDQPLEECACTQIRGALEASRQSLFSEAFTSFIGSEDLLQASIRDLEVIRLRLRSHFRV